MTDKSRTIRLSTQALATTLARARCPSPSQLRKIRDSLARHGQLHPILVCESSPQPEIIDGFKRHRGAMELGLESMLTTLTRLDPRAQWTTMLILNHGRSSISELEEALILRELCATGLTQVEIGQMVGRHKAWVSRRIGLVERLHADLVESMRLGILHPGVARRLLALPQGNQRELATAAMAASLGPQDTERWLRLWRRAPAQEIRRFILEQPREALARAYPEKMGPAPDARLTARGQTLQLRLRLLSRVAVEVTDILRSPVEPEDRTLLQDDLQGTAATLTTLVSRLGSSASGASDGASGVTGAMS